ncbi:hypothetical protein [Candidatus Liberibacter solanacearum]|uniref:hypothetical protein n=1 Tax=Candidatus Liberibacter solanacearum TaxID=556287 RepID=UPI001FCE0057|nr:hypothetical protein [Candidatus Liberibacter solanacearum]
MFTSIGLIGASNLSPIFVGVKYSSLSGEGRCLISIASSWLNPVSFATPLLVANSS